jgi:hypothetical protein
MMVPDNIGTYGSAPIDEGPANMDELRRKHLEDRRRMEGPVQESPLTLPGGS